MDRAIYSSDLTDEQWQMVEKLLPSAKPGGRPRTTNLREVVNGILYLMSAGCSWRMLPHDFPPWPTVHDYYRHFRQEGIWDKLHKILHKERSTKNSREPSPGAVVIDSQPVERGETGRIFAKGT